MKAILLLESLSTHTVLPFLMGEAVLEKWFEIRFMEPLEGGSTAVHHDFFDEEGRHYIWGEDV